MKTIFTFLFSAGTFFWASNAISQCTDVQTFLYTGGVQTFTVPVGVNTITVECYGAKGGNGNQPTSIGGNGAYMKGDITVTPGETLNIISGGMGVSGVAGLEGGGGGGGAFVIRATGNVPLIIAGGGGGGSYQSGTPGSGGSASTTGNAGGYVPTLPGMGGFSDNGGGGGTGAGGGGWNANGSSNSWATGGTMQGGAGGVSLYIGDGGFGGGGAAYHGGGGGGGYSGGGGGTYTVGGGGAGSYNTGSNQTNTASVNTGNGYVVLTYASTYFTTESVNVCYGADYIFPDGSSTTNVTSQVIYTSTLTAVVGGCDSLVETTVDPFPQIDNGAVQTGITITADASAGTFQWLNCATGYSVIASETSQAFTASADGSYAVEITDNGCVDTSSCFTVLYFGINSNDMFDFSISPNPATENIFISHASDMTTTYAEVLSITGAVVKNIQINQSTQTAVSISDLNSGIYFIRLVSADGSNSRTEKLIVR